MVVSLTCSYALLSVFLPTHSLLSLSSDRETLRRTRCLDELSDDDDDVNEVDIDDLDTIVAHEAVSNYSYASHELLPLDRLAGSPLRKRRDELQYAVGESLEGTSVLSSNPSILSSNQSFVSSASSSSGDGSVPFALLTSSAMAGLSGHAGSRHNSGSDTHQLGSTRGRLRSRHLSASSTGGGALKRVGSMTPQEAEDLEQTFRLRMLLFPDESSKANSAVPGQDRSPEMLVRR